MMDEYRRAEIDSRIEQMDIAIKAFLEFTDSPLFVGHDIRTAAEKIRELRKATTPSQTPSSQA